MSVKKSTSQLKIYISHYESLHIQYVLYHNQKMISYIYESNESYYDEDRKAYVETIYTLNLPQA